jgi:hypothetical protein
MENKAWLRPSVKVGELDFVLICNKKIQMNDEIKGGVFHGRFIEMLLAHSESDFTSV